MTLKSGKYKNEKRCTRNVNKQKRTEIEILLLSDKVKFKAKNAKQKISVHNKKEQ